jgi:COMPASS component SWD2
LILTATLQRFGARPGDKPFHVTSLDFDDTGELCLAARDDETVHIYNCKDGKHTKELKSQKYGVDIAKFTHHSQSIIYASTKIDDTIRYLSAHDNTYIRYFRGHTAPVTSLSLSPGNDNFISCSLDNTVKLWDLRSTNPTNNIVLTSPYLAVYDPGAVVLAIACPLASTILLYDARQVEAAPFATFSLSAIEAQFVSGRSGSTGKHTPGDWTKLEFSADSKKLLVATSGPGHYVLDAYDGPLIAYLPKTNGSTKRIPPSLRPRVTPGPGQQMPAGAGVTGTGDACFSPDGQFVIGGSGEAGMLAWDLKIATKHFNENQGDGAVNIKQEKEMEDFKPNPLFDAEEKVLLPSHTIGEDRKDAGMVSCVAYNPRHNLLATADRSVVFWLPDME